MQSESFLEAETLLCVPLWCCHVSRLVPLALDWQCRGRFRVSLSRLPDCLLNDSKFLYFHCSCVCVVYVHMCFVHERWCMCMGVHACVEAWESSSLALPSYPLRQGVSVKLDLHFSSLQGILGVCPWRRGLQVGHHAQLAFI